MERKLRRAGRTSRGKPFVAAGNVVNPRTGSGMQQAREGEEEKTAGVARNHRSGT
jgi:hypothetical protein